MVFLGSSREGDALKGTPLNPHFWALFKGDLMERLYILKGPPNPNSQVYGFQGFFGQPGVCIWLHMLIHRVCHTSLHPKP